MDPARWRSHQGRKPHPVSRAEGPAGLPPPPPPSYSTTGASYYVRTYGPPGSLRNAGWVLWRPPTGHKAIGLTSEKRAGVKSQQARTYVPSYVPYHMVLYLQTSDADLGDLASMSSASHGPMCLHASSRGSNDKDLPWIRRTVPRRPHTMEMHRGGVRYGASSPMP